MLDRRGSDVIRTPAAMIKDQCQNGGVLHASDAEVVGFSRVNVSGRHSQIPSHKILVHESLSQKRAFGFGVSAIQGRNSLTFVFMYVGKKELFTWVRRASDSQVIGNDLIVF